MSEGDPSERLAALEERIEAAKAEPETKRHTDEHYSQAQLAWRMVIELVVGLGIGLGLGYGLDRMMGTGPWLMIVFTILGFAAGIRTMMRSAHEVQAQMIAAQAAREDEGQDGK